MGLITVARLKVRELAGLRYGCRLFTGHTCGEEKRMLEIEKIPVPL